MTKPESRLVAVDGTDALAFVIVRPGATEGAVSIEAAAKGLSKPAAAHVLRNVAEQWAPADGPRDTEFPATWAGGHALVIEYGDCEFYARCQCGKPFGTARPDKPLDEFGGPWERHVMTLGNA